MWIYVIITSVLYIVLWYSYLMAKWKNKIGVSLFFPGLVATVVLIVGIEYNFPKDIKLVNYHVDRIVSKKEISSGEIIEKYYMKYTTINGEEEMDISKNTYRYFSSLWGSDNITTKNYDFNNKVVEVVKWDNNPSTALIYSKPVVYTNYKQNLLSVYNINKVSLVDALKNNLFIRESIGVVNENNVLEPRQNLVLGINIPDSLERRINYVASLDSEYRPILLVYLNESREKTKLQRSFWSGGRENEIVFCVGINDNNTVMWSSSFSWFVDKRLERYIKSNVLEKGEKLDIEKYVEFLEESYKNGYFDSGDKSYESYNFIKISLEELLLTIMMISVIIINIIVIIKAFKFKKQHTT